MMKTALKITELQNKVLLYLSGGERTMHEVAVQLGFRSSRAEAVLDALTRKGLVEWEPFRNRWRLSEKGKRLLRS